MALVPFPVASAALVVAIAISVVGGLPAAAVTPTTTLGTAPAQTPASSGRTLVNAAIDAAKQASSCHFVEQASAGKNSFSVVGDVSPSKGHQTITLRYGSSVGHMDGLWSGGSVFYRGDSYGLRSFLDMSAALARKYQNRWIEFSKSDQGFAQTAQQFTVQGPLSEISLTGKLSILGHSEVDGVKAQSVGGQTMALSSNGATGTGTLYVASDGTQLPVRFVGTGHQGTNVARAKVDFSHWGESVVADPPTTSIAASKVR